MSVPQIHRIRIEKFRRIQEPLELDLTSPKGAPSRNIVLAGPNGCGKTRVRGVSPDPESPRRFPK